MKTTKELLQARQKELQAELAEIEKSVEPLRAAREKLRAGVQPMEDEMRKLQKAIAAIEQPRAGDLRAELSALAKALGSKIMTAAPGAIEGGK